MAVDGLEYDEAMKIFDEIAMTNRRGIGMAAAPFYTGFSVAVVAGYGSIPAVFDLGSVEWINDTFVTTELPPMEDLETYLEVGSASWGWMEPVLGQISFFLLCMQFARSQMQNLGMRPYYNWQKERRAQRLVSMYPKYDPEFLSMYSRCTELHASHKLSP